MPVLRNPKHEMVAQELAVGKTAEDASRFAGYPENPSFDGNARKRAIRSDIRNRVAELLGSAAVRAEITVEMLICEAEAARAKAMAEKGGAAAAIAAITAKAKLAGLWLEKSERTNRYVDPERIPDAELASYLPGDRSPHPAQTANGSSKPH